MQRSTSTASHCMGYSSGKEELNQSNKTRKDEDADQNLIEYNLRVESMQRSTTNGPSCGTHQDAIGKKNPIKRTSWMQHLIIILMIGLLISTAFVLYKLYNLDRTQCSCTCNFESGTNRANTIAPIKLITSGQKIGMN